MSSPYFQPIRDNRTQEITKYEALMRLSDKDHNIYAPGQFLEIAKDYHLYLQLSQLMIQRCWNCSGIEETVFSNLSAYDISSSASRFPAIATCSAICRPGHVANHL